MVEANSVGGQVWPQATQLLQRASAFGAALHDHPALQTYRQVAAAAADDGAASQLKARLAATYAELVQRQATGEVLSSGEIEAFYALERQVDQHPLLRAEREALEGARDLLTEAHILLTNELGLSLQDLLK
jgi:cell fate (sporulation/competence/biofilm development) regulator YlbF (YheA/YmcA/DUF963 family)